MGTDHCDSSSGKCVCKPNVIGEKCDRCEIHHYGFQSGRGCSPCNCKEASDSEQCDDDDGQCMCKPGVTDRACDRCAPGYWNYTSEGCICKYSSKFSTIRYVLCLHETNDYKRFQLVVVRTSTL